DETLHRQDAGFAVVSGAVHFLEGFVHGVIGADDFFERAALLANVGPEARGFVFAIAAVAFEREADAVEVEVFELGTLQVFVDDFSPCTMTGAWVSLPALPGITRRT